MSIANVEIGIEEFRSTAFFMPEPRSVFDPISRCHLVVATPDCVPDLWRRYLAGASDLYAAHGVSAALDYDAVVDGSTTTLFFVAVDQSGVIRGGHRAQGPYLDVEESHALVEWAGNDGRDALIESVGSRLRDGVVEMKTAWVDPTVENPSTVAGLLARVAVPTMTLTGARYIMATAAEHVLRRWSSSGGRVDKAVPAAAYPDERYRTSLMWWDRETMERYADPAVWQKICDEAKVWTGVDPSSGQRSVA